MVWRSGTDAGRPGHNGSRVGESILVTGTSQNQSRGSDSLVVKNLQNPQYMEIILNGKATLAERFAEVDVDQVRKLFAEEQKVARKYPKRMGEVFKISHLPTRLGMIQPKQASCS